MAKPVTSVAMPAGFASPVSRRVSEIVGVALFALSLIWLIALASYDPNDAAWFFATGSNDVPANFIGRVGAFLAELSFQVVGFASYLLPALVAAGGWQYFWCRPVDALYTKATGVTLLFACTSAMLSLLVGSATSGARTFEAGGFVGALLASWFTAYLNRTGSIIVIVTLMALALILATQVSLGRVFAVAMEQAARGADGLRARGQAWLDERRRQKQRREVLAKHGRTDTPPAETRRPRRRPAADRAGSAPCQPSADVKAAAVPAVAPRAARPPPVVKRPTPVAPPLPLAEAEPIGRAPAERRQGGVHAAAGGAARSGQGRTQGRRARAHGLGAAPRGEVPRILGRGRGGADPSRPGGHDLRVQARRRREVQQGHRAGRRSVPGDEGRIGAHRPDSRQVHGRHPDPEPEPRGDLAARAARVGRLPALGVEADHRARQDHPRRAVHGRSGDDAAPADRRFDRHRQVGRAERDAHQHALPRHARRRAADHDRPQAARARDVRGHPAPADAGGRRSEEGGQRAALGGARDGGALQAPGRRSASATSSSTTATSGNMLEHKEVPTAPRRPGCCPSSSSSSTSWPT